MHYINMTENELHFHGMELYFHIILSHIDCS